MEGWKEGTIKSVASIGNGRDYKHLKEGNVPVFGTGGYMTSVRDFLYEGETVCIGRKGTIDTPLYHSGKIWTVDTLFYTHSFDNILPKLLFYIFQTIDWKKYNEATGVPSLSKKTIEQIKIIFPESEVEQSKITTILNTIELSIAQTEQLIAKYKNIKKGLLHDLLTYGIDQNGNIRNPQTHTFLQKNGMMVPEEWTVDSLVSITTKIGDGIHTTPKYKENTTYSFINGNNLKNGKIIIDDKTNTVSKEEYEKYKIELNQDSILMSINGTIGNLAIYQGQQVILGKSACYINCKRNFNRDFLLYFFGSSFMDQYLTNELTGSTIKNLSLASIRKMPICIPKPEEQNKIAVILKQQDNLIESEQTNLAKLQKLKQGLMQDLLTGKVRVEVNV